MSLINEALKKAQHQRAHQQPGDPATDGRSAARGFSGRRGPIPVQWVILLVAGAAVLVSVSVFATIYLVRKPVSSIAIKSEERVMSASEPLPSTTPPTNQVSAPSPAGSPAPADFPTAPIRPERAPETQDPKSQEPQIVLPSSVAPSPAHAKTIEHPAPPVSPPAPVPAPKISGKGTAEVQAVVDAFRVTGVRVSKNEAKVLMNDRVYRMNDIVDRTHGLKLMEVSAERLVFVDENGISYVKNF